MINNPDFPGAYTGADGTGAGVSAADSCLHGLSSCEQCAHAFGPQWNEAAQFREEQQTFNDEFTADWRSDYADSVGMPLHERFRP